MLIRSQCKTTLFSMVGNTVFINDQNQIIGYGNSISYGGAPTLLGCYETEERAIEVLDEICNAYISLNKCMGKEFRSNNPSGYFGGYVKNGVFQMPEV